MSRSLEDKKQIVADLKQLLAQSQLAVVIDFEGLTVSEITDLRSRLREKGGICKITKNTLMAQAVKDDAQWQPLVDLAKNSSAFLLIKEDLGGALKAYQAFQKDSKKTDIKGGVMEGKALSQAEVKAIADLPSKEQLLGQIAGAINGVATKLARGINEVPTSIARGIKAIAEKDDQDDQAA